MAKSKKALADAAYLKTETLVGQIDAFDGVQGVDTTKPIIEDSGASAPPVCPHCGEKSLLHAGGIWTHLKQWEPRDGWRVQCNMCGGIVVVSAAVWTEVREFALATFRDRGKPGKLANPGKRSRGAR